MKAAAAARLPEFRFDAGPHEYFLDGERIPGVTEMLARCGHVSEDHYTVGSAERGHQVHLICAQFDLGHIEDLTTTTSGYKGWLTSYAGKDGFCDRQHPQWHHGIEVARCSYKHRFGTRPDRVGEIAIAPLAIVDLKSGQPERWHGIQLALHDIVCAEFDAPYVPIKVRKRYALYLKPAREHAPRGRRKPPANWRLKPYEDDRDYDIAREVIRHCCR